MSEFGVCEPRRSSHSIAVLFLTLLILVSLQSPAETLSEPALFARCYSQITGRPVPVGHPLMVKVRAGQATALDSCFAILAKGTLGANGQISDKNDSESVAVLNQFYNFHR